MNKKILIISSSTLFVENFLKEIIQLLIKKNDIYLFTNLNQNIRIKNLKLINIPFERKPSLNDFINLPKTIYLIYKIKPNFIITCTPKIILYGIFISIFLRIKRIHIYTGIYWELFHGFKKIFYSLIDKINFSQCKRVFFDSNYQINFFKNKGYNSKNFSLISRGSVKGVNLNIFYKNDNLRQIQRSKYNLKNTDKVILFLGRLDHNKGVVCLLEAFKILSKNNNNYFLFLVGKNEMMIEKEIKNYKFLINKIFVLPHTNHPESFYNLCDVVCIPSLREGFGSVAVEASACEKPIVSSDIHSLSESVIDKFNGIKFNVNDSIDLSIKIKSVLDDDIISTKYGKNGRSYVIKYYDSKKVINDFYKQLLNNI